MNRLASYFREKPYRFFYWSFFILIYLSASLQAVTPLAVIPKAPLYLPEKRSILFSDSRAKGQIKAYYGENFFYPENKPEVWMKNHALVVLENLTNRKIKIDLRFWVKSYLHERTLRIKTGDRVLKWVKVAVFPKKTILPKIALEPGEQAIYFYTPEESAVVGKEFGFKREQEISLAFSSFRVVSLNSEEYTLKEKLEIAKQEILHLIDQINYVYLTIAAFVMLAIAFGLHIYFGLKTGSPLDGGSQI